MKVTTLGTSAGLPTPERGMPAVLVELEGEFILFDCGEGTQRQMLKVGASLGRRMKVFITHMHGDHVFGLPGMVQTMSLINRTNPLEVYGPPGIGQFIEETTISTMSEPSFSLKVFEVSEGEICQGKGYRVDGAWADHTKPDIAYRMTVGESLGRLLPEKAAALGIPEGPMRGELKKGKSIILKSGQWVEPAQVLGRPKRGKVFAYSGDTRPAKSVTQIASGADLLIHESTLSGDLAEIAERDGHSTAGGAAQVAAEAKAKKLVLTHISARYPDAGLLLEEAKMIFPNVEIAEDLKTYIL